MKVGATWLSAIAVLLVGQVASAGTEVVNFGTTGSTMPLEATPLSSTVKSGAQLSLFPRSAIPMLPPGVPITGIEIDKLEPGAVANAGTLRIYLGNTTQTSVPAIGTTLAQAKSTMTLVYSSTAQAVAEPAGWWSPGAFNGDAFTYTGDGLLVLTEFDRAAAPTVTGNTRLMFGCLDLMSTTRGLEVRSEDALTDTLAFNGGDVRSPNLRFTFTTPNTPYLVVTAGDTKIANGATYAQPYAYVGAAATSQKIKLRNAGGMPITFGAVTFSDLTGITETPTVTTPPPVMLAVGASAEMEFSVTPTAVGTIEYRLNIGSDASNQPFNFAINTFANTTAAPEIQVSFVDSAGRNDSKQSPNQRNQPIGVPIPFQIKVSNIGSAPLNLTSITETLETNTVGSCTAPSSTVVAPLTDLLIDCTHTITAAGFARYVTEIQHDDVGWSSLNVFVDSQGIVSISSGTTTADMAASTDMAGIVESTDLAGADLTPSAPRVAVLWRDSDAPADPGGGYVGGLQPIENGGTLTPIETLLEAPDRPAQRVFEPFIVYVRNLGTAPLVISSFNSTDDKVKVIPDRGFSFPITIAPGEEHWFLPQIPLSVEKPTTYPVTLVTNDPVTPTFAFSIVRPGDPIPPPIKEGNCSVGFGATPDGLFIMGAMLAVAFARGRTRRPVSRQSDVV